MRKEGWDRTRLREILPVQCRDYEDLIESTEGFMAGATSVGAEVFGAINLETFPPILGYNKILSREGCPTLLAIKETGDPLVATGTFGAGKTLACMSNPAPHLGCNFVFWEQYASFWLRCLEWVVA